MQEPRRRLDDYSPQEMAIPEWRIIQKVGADYAKEQGGEAGQFYNTITGEIIDELNLIIVDILSGRAKWGDEITSSGPVCASIDAKSNKSISGADCSECPHRLDTPWSVTAPERRTMCCLNYTLLAIDLDHEHMPVMLRLHGINALPARQLITQLRMNRSLKGEYHRAIINATSSEKNTPYGIAYTTHLKLISLITDEVEANELLFESQRLLGTPIPLPEGRPEDEEELQPEYFTPEGKPIFSNEKLPPAMRRSTEPLHEEIPPEEEPKESPKEEIDLNI